MALFRADVYACDGRPLRNRHLPNSHKRALKLCTELWCSENNVCFSGFCFCKEKTLDQKAAVCLSLILLVEADPFLTYITEVCEDVNIIVLLWM